MVRIKTTFAVLLMVSLLGTAACSDDDDDADGGGTTAAPDVETTSTTAAEGNEPILIKTHVAFRNASEPPTGEVLSGSTIGDSAFCVGGRFGERKEPGTDLVTRIFRCSGGTLTITFTSTPPDVKQRSDWEVVKGLGSFEGLSGGGRMTGVLDANGEGSETFTGTVTR